MKFLFSDLVQEALKGRVSLLFALKRRVWGAWRIDWNDGRAYFLSGGQGLKPVTFHCRSTTFSSCWVKPATGGTKLCIIVLLINTHKGIKLMVSLEKKRKNSIRWMLLLLLIIIMTCQGFHGKKRARNVRTSRRLLGSRWLLAVLQVSDIVCYLHRFGVQLIELPTEQVIPDDDEDDRFVHLIKRLSLEQRCW